MAAPPDSWATWELDWEFVERDWWRTAFEEAHIWAASPGDPPTVRRYRTGAVAHTDGTLGTIDRGAQPARTQPAAERAGLNPKLVGARRALEPLEVYERATGFAAGATGMRALRCVRDRMSDAHAAPVDLSDVQIDWEDLVRDLFGAVLEAHDTHGTAAAPPSSVATTPSTDSVDLTSDSGQSLSDSLTSLLTPPPHMLAAPSPARKAGAFFGGRTPARRLSTTSLPTSTFPSPPASPFPGGLHPFAGASSVSLDLEYASALHDAPCRSPSPAIAPAMLDVADAARTPPRVRKTKTRALVDQMRKERASSSGDASRRASPVAGEPESTAPPPLNRPRAAPPAPTFLRPPRAPGALPRCSADLKELDDDWWVPMQYAAPAPDEPALEMDWFVGAVRRINERARPAPRRCSMERGYRFPRPALGGAVPVSLGPGMTPASAAAAAGAGARAAAEGVKKARTRRAGRASRGSAVQPAGTPADGSTDSKHRKGRSSTSSASSASTSASTPAQYPSQHRPQPSYGPVHARTPSLGPPGAIPPFFPGVGVPGPAHMGMQAQSLRFPPFAPNTMPLPPSAAYGYPPPPGYPYNFQPMRHPQAPPHAPHAHVSLQHNSGFVPPHILSQPHAHGFAPGGPGAAYMSQQMQDARHAYAPPGVAPHPSSMFAAF